MLVATTVYIVDADLRIAHPAMLLPACLWLLLPVRRKVIANVQAAVFLYLMWILFASAFEVFWTSTVSGDGVCRVSMTVPAVVLMGVGWLLRCVSGRSAIAGRFWIKRVLFGAAAVIAGHALFLWVLLRPVYGYGWEEDAAVFGRIGLCTIVLTGLIPVACSRAMRGSLALMMTAILLTRKLA